MTVDVEELQTMVAVLRKDNLALQERIESLLRESRLLEAERDDLMNEMCRIDGPP